MRAETEHTPDIEQFAREYVRGGRPAFQPTVSYSSVADAVFAYTKDEPAYHKRVDAMFTILYSSNREFVGCIIKGISELWDNAPPGTTTFEAVFEQYVRRNTKVVWSYGHKEKNFVPGRDLADVMEKELQIPESCPA